MFAEFISGDLHDIKKDFDIEEKDCFFPICLPQKALETPELVENSLFPEFNHFIDPLDSEKQVKQKEEFYEKNKSLGAFDFKLHLIAYSWHRLALHSKVILTFCKEVFNLQIECFKSNCLISPFDKSITIAGFAFNLLSHYGLKTFKDVLFAMPPYKKTQSSNLEIEYMLFLKSFRPTILFHYSHASNPLFKIFKNCSIPDGYDPKEHEAFFFHECNIHGHNFCSSCSLKDKCTEIVFKQTAAERHYETVRKQDELQKLFPGLKISQMYECQWLEQKKSLDWFTKTGSQNVPLNNTNDSKEDLTLLSSKIFRPKDRLSCREAMRGGYQELFSLKYIKRESDVFYVLDVSSH